MPSTTSAADTTETDETATNTGNETTASAGDETRTADEALSATVDLTVPASADRGEAAAIAAAVGAHLRDRTAVEAASDKTPKKCNRWKLCGRLGGRKPPREALRGEEWKTAGRARW